MTNNPLNHLTPEERARLRELASKATPAPWRWAVERHAVLRLLDEIERRPPPLVWSKEPPAVVGLWAFRSIHTGNVYCAKIDVIRNTRHGVMVEWNEGDRLRVVLAKDFEWCFIPQPSEASE